MIIDRESYFRFPPKNLKPEQVIVFNAITFSIDICELTFQRLNVELIEFSKLPKSENENYPRIFADVWTIISNATIFLNLITRYFDVNQNEVVLNELNKAKRLRNSYQHIDERITEILTLNDLPIYGALSWVRNVPNSNKMQQFILYSGVFTNHKESIGGQISTPRKEEKTNEIDGILFESITKSGKNKFPKILISINKLMLDINNLIDHFEKQLTEQLSINDKIKRHNTNIFFQLNSHWE